VHEKEGFIEMIFFFNFSSGLDEGETHAFPLNDIRKNQAKMNFSTPFTQEI
jgi:hypothetical protein